MNGPHDMGGMQCYGPIEPEPNEPVFHAEWERKALALTVASGFCGQWNIDISRHARETLPPGFYLTKSYYQIWLAGLERLMVERGMLTVSETQSGNLEQTPVAIKRVVNAIEMPDALAAGAPVERDPQEDPVFAVGDEVCTVNINPTGHTRLPRYVRGKKGTIAAIHGCHVFPDTNAHGKGENPHWLYSVEFDGHELFGKTAEANASVLVDCWEPYLEKA